MKMYKIMTKNDKTYIAGIYVLIITTEVAHSGKFLQLYRSLFLYKAAPFVIYE